LDKQAKDIHTSTTGKRTQIFVLKQARLAVKNQQFQQQNLVPVHFSIAAQLQAE
jgi:hypothetical protein